MLQTHHGSAFLLLWVLMLHQRSVHALSSSLQRPDIILRKVVVVGGTHGNEYTGVWCIKAMEQQYDAFTRRYPSLEISTILGNPAAHRENKRFIHTDLNREFSVEKRIAPQNNKNEYNDHNIGIKERNGKVMYENVEKRRARELDALLGSKCVEDQPSQVDVAIDLHTSTSNMGITLIIPENDLIMAQAAAYVTIQCPGARCLMLSIPDRKDRQNLSSCAKHGFAIEVGPVPQGLLRHDTVEKTQQALQALLEFLEQRNQNGEDNVLRFIRTRYPSGRVPCFRAAPARRAGELSGKIAWPLDNDNPNFPAVMVHKSIQDRDYQILRTGDPLFVSLDGSVIHYDGSHGDEVYLIFVNEAGYYYSASGTGIGVAVAAQFDIMGANPVQ